MSQIKYPSSFIRDRRIRLGLASHEVAAKLGISQETYRQWEHRGELPESYFPKLAIALDVPENELKAEKVATMVQATLGIPKEDTHGFIAKALRKDV